MNLPRITFKAKKLSFTPDPVIVKQGENIEIELFADLTNSDYSIHDILKHKNLVWKLHFKNGNPFHREPYKTFEFITSIREGAPLHSDIIQLGVTQNKGEFKFDIALLKAPNPNFYPLPDEYDKDDLIEELDPIIIVL